MNSQIRFSTRHLVTIAPLLNRDKKDLMPVQFRVAFLQSVPVDAVQLAQSAGSQPLTVFHRLIPDVTLHSLNGAVDIPQ